MLSYLLIPKQNSKISSLEELVTSSMSWVIRHGTSTESLFMVILDQQSIGTQLTILVCLMKEAGEDDRIYWKIGERIRQNPELLIGTGSERYTKIRNLVAGKQYAFIGVC